METVWSKLQDLLVTGNPLARYVVLFAIAGLAAVVFRGFLQTRKIQPNGFKWKAFRHELPLGALNVASSTLLIGGLSSLLTKVGLVHFNTAPAAWWVTILEYAAYFLLFDTWFYWLHRWMHLPRVYPWVHKPHHWSTSPNLLTTLSVSPIESLINGGFVPIFTALLTVHSSTMALITPTNIVMGLYVHAGYEFLPRWWHKTWATKWFITTTFHDQHHKYFNWNFGGYTQIWDWICGTVRPKYVADFEQMQTRRDAPPESRSLPRNSSEHIVPNVRCKSAAADIKSRMPTFILIHGAFHGGWCWEHVVPLLERAGHKVIAPNLPGMGGDPTPLNQVTLARTGDFVADLARRQSEPVILAGHSMGGLAISEAAERVPDHIAGLIYVTALLVPGGVCLRDFQGPTQHAGSASHSTDGISATYNPAVARETFYNRTPSADVQRAIARLTPQPLAPITEPVTATSERFGRVPRAFIECTDDNILGIARQREMQAALPCDPVFTMVADHSPFLCAPDELTNHLIAAAAAMTRRRT